MDIPAPSQVIIIKPACTAASLYASKSPVPNIVGLVSLVVSMLSVLSFERVMSSHIAHIQPITKFLVFKLLVCHLPIGFACVRIISIICFDFLEWPLLRALHSAFDSRLVRQVFLLAIEAFIVASLVSKGSLTEEEGNPLRPPPKSCSSPRVQQHRSSTMVHYGASGPAPPL